MCKVIKPKVKQAQDRVLRMWTIKLFCKVGFVSGFVCLANVLALAWAIHLKASFIELGSVLKLPFCCNINSYVIPWL